jgi:RNA polymerase sigma-70 factor (ECF subfamily)
VHLQILFFKFVITGQRLTPKLTNTEEELVNGLKARSQQAFASLYDNYSAAMLGIINTIVNNVDESENLLQDSFIKIWKNIHRYDAAKGRLFTWLLTICRNTAFNFLRSRENFTKIEIQNDSNGVYTERLTCEPVHLNYIGVGKEVEKLDEKHRVVINLIYFWGYTQQEVAEKLSLPLGTVKTRTRAALQILKTQLRH